MVRNILIKSPDEWATTKQACRDESVVYSFPPQTYTSLYINVLSTVLRVSAFYTFIKLIYISTTFILHLWSERNIEM